MLKPSQHRQNAERRIAEVEAESEGIESTGIKYGHQAGAFKANVLHYAGLADLENAERIVEQRQANSISHALDIIEIAEPDDFTDGAIASLVHFLCVKMAERNKPVAWAGKGLNMEPVVAELSQLMAVACHEDGLVIGDGSMRDEYDEERRLFDRAEARAINAGAA